MEETQFLSQQQVADTLMYFEEFNNAFNSVGMSAYGNVLRNKYFTPDLINEALKSINMNPQKPSSANDINKALSSIGTSEKILRNYATYFELNNLFYKRLIKMNANLLAWNLTFDCINIEKESEFKSKEFKADLKIVDDFCSRFDIKKDFRVIVNQILRQGVYYGVFRDEGDMYSWQELPPDFCKITGNSSVGRLFDFDFSYFINKSGTNIDMYPRVFKKKLNQIYEQLSDSYNPKGKIDTRHSSYCYWIDVSPRDNFFCFNLDDGLNTLVPYYSSLFPDLYIQPMMRELEKNKAMISAQKLLVNLLETYDNAKSGTVPNQYKITPKDIGQFMALVKQALGDTAKAIAIPAKDAKIVDFNVEANNRYTNYQRNIAANAVSSSASMLTENKLNAFESELALDIDANFVKTLYGQFEKFLNYYVNKKTSKYKFKFKLNDTNTKLDRTKRSEQFKELASMGLVDINLYARATDQNVFEAQRSLQFTKSIGMDKLLTQLQSLNNQTKETGRPQTKDKSNDNTMASDERGSNELAE